MNKDQVNSFCGVKMIPIDENTSGYLGTLADFLDTLKKKAQFMKQPGVAKINGEVYIFDAYMGKPDEFTEFIKDWGARLNSPKNQTPQN